jgi:hypothetical protein
VENFFSTLKTELVYRTSWQTRLEAENALFVYIDTWCNRERIQARLGWRSPDEYEAIWHADHTVLDDHPTQTSPDPTRQVGTTSCNRGTSPTAPPRSTVLRSRQDPTAPSGRLGLRHATAQARAHDYSPHALRACHPRRRPQPIPAHRRRHRLRDLLHKVHNRVLRPLLATDRPQAPPPLRPALHTIDQHVHARLAEARLPSAAA